MKTLLVFAFILSNLHLIFADWQHPLYSFRCLENGDVELFGVHKESSIIVDGSLCPYQTNTTKLPSGVYVIPQDCLKDGLNATISVYDKEFDGISGPLTTSTTTGPKIIGGHVGHKFVITCEDIPETGINRTVAHVFQEKEYKELPDNYKEVSDVEMRFKAVNNPAAPDISTVYIGDEFYMFINYTGKQHYAVIPEECTAIGGTSFPKGRDKSNIQHSVTLWDINNKKGSKCVQQDSLLENFVRQNNTLIYAKMYGFRFSKKEYITITCQVRIYAKKDLTDGSLCITTPKTTSSTTTPIITSSTPIITSGDVVVTGGRRKRDIETMSFQTKSLAKKLLVYDSRDLQLAENISQKIKMETCLWIVILTVVTFRAGLADQ